MFSLYGLRTDYFQKSIGGSFEPEQTKELVATFDSEKDAKAYVKASELGKIATHAVDIQRGRYRFRRGSLLRQFDDYEIIADVPVEVPHNPKV
jgi:hypothetical protein